MAGCQSAVEKGQGNPVMTDKEKAIIKKHHDDQ
jgi:hypothetical protein